MKKLKICAILLCCIVILNSFCTANITEENLITTMTLDEAVEYALSHNANVVDINRMVKDQKEVYDDAKDIYREWQYKIRSGGYSFETPQEYLDCWGYSFELAELGYNSFLATKSTTEETIGYTVKQFSYTIAELYKSIELLEKTITKQEMDVKIAEVKNSLNMVTILEVEAAKQTLTSTKLQLDSLKSTLDSLETNLKSIMGFDVSKELVVTIPDYELNILEIEDLAKTIEDSLETNGKAITEKISYKQKEINYILATKTHLLIKDEIKDAKREYSDAEARLNNSINTIKNNLYNLYTNVKTSEESTILAKSEYEQLQIKYNQMKVMHELGMITTHDFNSYEIALINAKNSYEASLHENILLNERWKIALKVGDVLADTKEV